jgi:hypothetical protein
MRRAVILLAAAAFLPAAIASQAWAGATRTPFTVTEASVPIQDGNGWLSGHIFHVRGEVDEGPVTGDLTGTITIVVNLNVDTHSGQGELFGTFTLATADVTWSGHYTGSTTSDTSRGRFLGQGTNGSKLDGSFTQNGDGTFTLTGTILSPHG